MRKTVVVFLLLCSGCATPPMIPQRYQLGVPTAQAEINPSGVVLIGASADAKKQEDGNVYTINFIAMTNSNSLATDDPQVIAANADLATNVWPKPRCHLDLSLDGGATWPRRIGYGVQKPKGGGVGEMIWSPPDDFGLLTTNAMLRMVDLDGNTFRGNTNGATYDVGPEGIRSPVFAIVGAVLDSPTSGEILYQNFSFTLSWRQVGGGDVHNLYWLTPSSMGADTNHFVMALSNCVDGANTHTVTLSSSIPFASEMRLAVRGVQYPSIIGYSPIFALDQ